MNHLKTVLIIISVSTINSVHQERKNKRGGGVCVYINKNYNFKHRIDFSAIDEGHETLSIEIINKNKKNIVVNTCYRPPNAKIKPLKSHITKILNSLYRKNPKIFFVGDFNLNSLDYASNSKVKGFIDNMFSKGLISVINKPTRVCKQSMTCIDHIYTNSFVNQDLTTGIIKTDISDHFPVFIIDKNMSNTNYPDSIIKETRSFSEKNVKHFKNNLKMTDWSLVLETQDPNQSYSVFLKQFLKIYNKSFPMKSITIKRKQLISPWITKGLRKSSKQKQKLYIKCLRHPSYKNEVAYKTYKNLFETTKNRSKIHHFSSLLKTHQKNSKETWKVIKEAVGKSKIFNDDFPKILLREKQEITEQSEIANYFNTFFTNVGSNLASKIPHSEKHFTTYIQTSDNILQNDDLTTNEFEKAFKDAVTL